MLLFDLENMFFWTKMMQIRSVLFILALAGTFSSNAIAGVLDIVGYPFNSASLENEKIPSWVGDDPVVGRLACPPITRLNLQSQKSEPVMLKGIRVDNATNSAKWILEPRTDLRWWSGALVTPTDFKDFFQENLEQVVHLKGLGLWTTPAHKVDLTAAGTVQVSWDQVPVFGPYILNGVPFSRRKARMHPLPAWECVGLYQTELHSSDRMRLVPTKSYSGNRSTLEFKKSAGVSSGPRLSFDMALSRDVTGERRSSDGSTSCANSVDLPLATIISWNTVSGPTAIEGVRRALTHLTPRGELVRSGASSLGDVLSAPIPRSHPGYDRSSAVRPYSLEQASKLLDELGFKRQKSDGPRLSQDGKPMKLELNSMGVSSPLLEKVLIDAFSLAGIGLEFSKSNAEGQQATLNSAINGIVVGIRLPLPDSDFMGNFHSRATEFSPFWAVKNKSLDIALEKYAITLTNEVPNFNLLQQVHRILYEVEPVTVLLQHRACVTTSGSGWTQATKVDSRDPDWFRKLVF